MPEPRSPDSWPRAQIGWTTGFWALIALSVLVLTMHDLSPGRRELGFGVITAVVLTYLVARPNAVDRSGWRGTSYTIVVLVAAGLAIGVDTDLSLLLFIFYPQLWLYADGIRQGIIFAILLTGSALLGFVSELGWTLESFRSLGPTMALSLLSSLLMGIWVSRIIDQSRERAALIEQLKTTRTELGEAHHAQGVMAERERVAREIHDTLAQGYTSIIMLAQTARAELEAHPDDQCATPTAHARLDSIELVARENLDEARTLVAAFSPVALEGATLSVAVQRLAERFGAETSVAIDLEVSAEGLGTLSKDGQVVLLRAAQEALTNVRRHAHARLVTLRLTGDEAGVLIEIEDDGTGFGPETPAGFGLTGMRDRARDTGGQLEVASVPGQGTLVRVRVPATDAVPAEAAVPPTGAPAVDGSTKPATAAVAT